MREVTKEEEKQIRLDILQYIKKVCNEYDINYSLTGGTLLGAVRHKGFIPWDDDIDVFMTRPEYEKFYDIMSNQAEYLWLTREYDKDYFLCYGRVVDKRTRIIDERVPDIEGYGIFVDVCVVDGLPENKFIRMLHCVYIRFLSKCRACAAHKYSVSNYGLVKRVVRRMVRLFACFVGIPRWTDWLGKAVCRYPFDGGQYVGNIMSQYGMREILPHGCFDSYIEMTFEDEKYSVCVGWETYLTQIYGDYMKLPPVEERKGHHTGTAYWVDG